MITNLIYKEELNLLIIETEGYSVKIAEQLNDTLTKYFPNIRTIVIHGNACLMNNTLPSKERIERIKANTSAAC